MMPPYNILKSDIDRHQEPTLVLPPSNAIQGFPLRIAEAALSAQWTHPDLVSDLSTYRSGWHAHRNLFHLLFTSEHPLVNLIHRQQDNQRDQRPDHRGSTVPSTGSLMTRQGLDPWSYFHKRNVCASQYTAPGGLCAQHSPATSWFGDVRAAVPCSSQRYHKYEPAHLRPKRSG